MRHPRRNELFRDVGGALHDKDDDDFVEVIEAAGTPSSALLLCTDGLTDMVPSATDRADRRRHAGHPQQVVDALVDAANEAGGHDNVTVVYAEGAAFAAWARQGDTGAGSGAEAGPGVEQQETRHRWPDVRPHCGGGPGSAGACGRSARSRDGWSAAGRPGSPWAPWPGCWRRWGWCGALPLPKHAGPARSWRERHTGGLSADRGRARGGAARRHGASRTRGVRRSVLSYLRASIW